MSTKIKFTEHLKKLNVKVYAVPVEEKEVIVLLGRLSPLNDRDLESKLSEARLLNYIERALKEFEEDDSVKARFSRPWLLKEGSLAYTWDFTFRGDLAKALEILEKVAIPSNPSPATEDTLKRVKPRRGTVKSVQIGRLV